MANNKATNNKKKLSYEELESLAANLNDQCNKMYTQLQKAHSIVNGFNLVGLLLNVLSKSDHFSEDFVKQCSSVIEDTVKEALKELDTKEESKE
jgi:hypothetical protein